MDKSFAERLYKGRDLSLEYGSPMRSLVIILFCLLFSGFCDSSKDPRKGELDTNPLIRSPHKASFPEAEYIVGTAVVGLKLRKGPSRSAETGTIVPFGVVRLVRERRNPETIDGRPGHWIRVSYLAEEGWIFDGYTETAKSFEGIRADRAKIVGTWVGQWSCAAKYTNLKLDYDGTFSGHRYNGGEMAGCSMTAIAGTWSILADGRVELQTTNHGPHAFHLTENGVLVADTSVPMWENFESEIVSGLLRQWPVLR